jgi:hypothetical protein
MQHLLYSSSRDEISDCVELLDESVELSQLYE